MSKLVCATIVLECKCGKKRRLRIKQESRGAFEDWFHNATRDLGWIADWHPKYDLCPECRLKVGAV